VPASNPFVSDADPATLGEIYVSGVRNPQRFGWDPRNANLFVADIGQDIVEELSLAPPGANLGWNKWEGSFGFISRTAIDLTKRRNDPAMTYPVVEYGQLDPLFSAQSAITGVHVYRRNTIRQLENLVLFGDFPSGEIFYVQADKLPSGGQDAIRRILLNDGGVTKTFLKIIQEKNLAQKKPPTTRADLRFGDGPNGQVFLLNKHDGTIRLLVPDGAPTR
jgi:glucose/arabinose dehydrogenase